MKTLDDLKKEVDEDIAKQMGDLIESYPYEVLEEIATNNVPNSDREVIEVFHSEHSLARDPDNQTDFNNVFEWLRASIDSALKSYAEEEFDRQKEDYEGMVEDFQKEGLECVEFYSAEKMQNLYYVKEPTKPAAVMPPTFNTEYEAWKAYEKEQ